IAATTSSAPPNATSSTTSSLPGSIRSQVPPPRASTHSPPMSMRRCGAPKSAVPVPFLSPSGMCEGPLPEAALGCGDGLADYCHRLVELFVREVEWRQDPQAVRVEASAYDDDAARQRLLGDLENELGPRCLGVVLDELGSQHGAQAANVPDGRVHGGQLLQPRPQPRTHLAGTRQEGLRGDLLERRESRGAGERVAGVRAAQPSWMRAVHDLRLADDRRDRHA